MPPTTTRVVLRPTDAAWAAGFIDGDGCIGAYRDGATYALSVSASQMVAAPLTKLKNLFGGYLYNHDERGSWDWRISNKRALEMLRIIYPYMEVKNRQAAIAFNFPLGTGGIKTPPLTNILREEVSNALKREHAAYYD